MLNASKNPALRFRETNAGLEHKFLIESPCWIACKRGVSYARSRLRAGKRLRNPPRGPLRSACVFLRGMTAGLQ